MELSDDKIMKLYPNLAFKIEIQKFEAGIFVSCLNH